MKLTAFFVLIILCTANAKSGYGQISLNEKEKPLSQVLQSIKEQTGYVFVSQNIDLDALKLSISVHNLPVKDALDSCFKNFSLGYKIVGRTVFIKQKDAAPSDFYSGPAVQQQLVIHGHVQDTAGNPLEGASILVKSSGTVLHTNVNGEFELDNAEPGDTLIISYIGYKSNIAVVTGKVRYLYVILKSSENELDKAIVQAYGTTTQRFTVGSISTVTSDEIEQQPVTNPLLALEGRVPGLVVTPTSGAPGANVQLQIRGQNTLRQISTGLGKYDQPLMIIDGVPFAPQNNTININTSLAGATMLSAYSDVAGGISPFNNINPADIESITVLKDADATSIYGSQGSNGVIIITTKKGKAGKTTLNIRLNTGPNKVTHVADMLNTQQYLQIRREAFAQDGIAPTAVNAPDLLVFDTTKYTDWFHQFMGGTANSTDAHLSVSGGTQTTTFILSGGYTRSVYNFPGDFADNRWTMHSGLHHSSLNRRFNIDMGTDISYDANNSAGSPGNGLTLPPDLPDLLDASGNLVWSYKGVDLSNYQAYRYLKQKSNLQSFTLNSTLKLSYRLATGLDISANIGYSRLTTQEYDATPQSSIPPNGYLTTSATFNENSFQTINIEPQANYNRKLGLGQLSVLIGGTYKKNIGYTSSIFGNNYSDDALLNSIAGASSITASNSNSIYKYAAAFGRINYIYDQKYIIDLTGRRDGSSNFGPGRQFGNYGAVGAGWIFSEEKGFKNAFPVISFGKLYANYGTSGSDGIAPYMYQAFWQPYTAGTFQGTRPYTPVNLYNPDYSWDTKKSLNIALNLGFLKDRINVEATWYRNRTGDQLVSYPLPSQVGFSTIVENLNATVQDMGWEFNLNTKNIIKKNFSWQTNFNISFNRNKLISFPGLANSTYANYYVIGKPASTVMGYKYKGVNDTTGLFQFYKANGTTTSTPTYSSVASGGDLQPIADKEPVFTGGFGNTFTYKGFSIFIFFNFAKQTAYNQLLAYYGGNSIPGGIGNLPEDFLGKYWQKPGDHAELEKLTTAYGDAENAAFAFAKSSGAFSDDSYLRLKTLSLSYSFPDRWVKKMHMQRCSIYINAQNLLTFTNYKGLDPELPGQIYIVPMQRTIAGGLSFDF